MFDGTGRERRATAPGYGAEYYAWLGGGEAEDVDESGSEKMWQRCRYVKKKKKHKLKQEECVFVCFGSFLWSTLK